ncbi:hypothetical protein D3C87_447600 [compost metagenome]
MECRKTIPILERTLPMNNNEIKKTLYREKPIAQIKMINSDGDLYFSAELKSGAMVKFFMPYAESFEIGDLNNIPAQLLIRWLVTEDKEVYGE